MRRSIRIEVAGLGLVLHSPWATQGIPSGSDFLLEHFTSGRDVAELTNRGAIVGVCTGSPGSYLLEFHSGPLDEEAVLAADHRVRLCLEIRDETLCVRDLYDLMSWRQEAPKAQCMELPDGFYALTAYTSLPPSEIVGDDQVIFVHLESTPSLIETAHRGVPLLCE